MSSKIACLSAGDACAAFNESKMSADGHHKKLILHLTRNTRATGGGPLVMTNLIKGVGEYEHHISGIFTKRAIKLSNGMPRLDLSSNCAMPTTKDLSYTLKSHKISKLVSELFQPTFPLRMYLRSRKRNVSLIHTHYSNRIDLQAKAILEYLKIPMVWTVHSLPDGSDNTTGQLEKFNRICERHEGLVTIVAVSQIVKEFAERHCFNARVKLIYNGSDVKKSDALGKREFLKSLNVSTQNPFIVCSVGRLNPEKGLGFLIGAAKEVVESSENIIFIHLGEGPLEESLKREVSRLGLGGKFFFLGHQKSVSAYLSVSDLFVMPSLNEAFGLALLEALHVGLPSVVTNVGGIPEVANSDCSVFVPPGNSKSIASAILELYQDENRLKTMSGAARKQSSKFSLNQMLLEYKSVYDELIGSQNLTVQNKLESI